MVLCVLFASVAASVAFELGGFYGREMAEVVFVGCVLCVLSVGANCNGWVVFLGWGRMAG